MAERIYEEVNYAEELKKRKQVATVLNAYVNTEVTGSPNTNTEGGNSNAAKNLQAQHTGDRYYKVTAVCVVLLCVLLLTAVTALWTKFNAEKDLNNQLQRERDKLQNLNNQLQRERDELQNLNNQLQRERDELRNLTNQIQLQLQKDELRSQLDVLGMKEKLRWISFNSSIYYFSEKAWAESREDCKEKGGDLVIINTKEEQDFITEQLLGGRAWIGLSDKDKEGNWNWVDGTPLNTGFRFWLESQPDNENDEDCAEVGLSASREWNDRQCFNRQGWICEKRVGSV